MAYTNSFNGSWQGWKTLITNSDLATFGYPIPKYVNNLHNIGATCFFHYDYEALENPRDDRGGAGICLYISSFWIALLVIPYNMQKIYIQSTINGSDWSEWSVIGN